MKCLLGFLVFSFIGSFFIVIATNRFCNFYYSTYPEDRKYSDERQFKYLKEHQKIKE